MTRVKYISLGHSVFVRFFFFIMVFINFSLRFYDIDLKGISHYYNSPLIILQSISLLFVFEQISINKANKFILFFSSSTFSVYLISDHPFFRYNYYADFWRIVESVSVSSFFIFALFLNFTIFFGCILIDKLRRIITDRIEQYLVIIIYKVI